MPIQNTKFRRLYEAQTELQPFVEVAGYGLCCAHMAQ